MSKKTNDYGVNQFLSLYRTYENLLRDHGTEYRALEDGRDPRIVTQQIPTGRLTIMRQMRNYLSHSEDPGFLAVSPDCLLFLEKLVKEEQSKGDLVKDHLVTPAKGSLKEGMPLSEAVYRLAKNAASGELGLPVYDPESKRLKGILMLEHAAYKLNRDTGSLLSAKECMLEKNFRLLSPQDPVPENLENCFYCCTKNGTLDAPYMGYLDK